MAFGTWHMLAPWSIDWWILIDGYWLEGTFTGSHVSYSPAPQVLSIEGTWRTIQAAVDWAKSQLCVSAPRLAQAVHGSTACHVNNNSRKGHSRVLLINKWHFLGYTWIHYRNGWHQLLVLDLVPLWKWDWVWRADASRHSFRMLSWLWCYPRSQSGYDEHAACQAISPGWPICTHHDSWWIFWVENCDFSHRWPYKIDWRMFPEHWRSLASTW